MSQRYLGGIITANPTTPTLTTESGVWTLEQQFQYSSVWSPDIIGNSLRFRSSASAYLSRTFGTATSTTQGTFSFWLKRGNLSASYSYLWSASNYDLAYLDSSGTLWVAYLSNLGYVSTNAVFRDPAAWYHIVITFDTPNATAADRLRVYVNGVQQTLNWGSTPQTQNATWQRWNVSGYTGDIGDFQYNHANGFDGYYAEWYFIDGQALTPSSFGAFDATGVWQPLLYTGTYGTNGFYLTFADNSGTTSTTLGKDYSGNGNNWTPNNFSLTAGTTYDWMLDSPTNWSNGTGNGRGNYCTLNPLDFGTVGGGSFNVPTNGNLDWTGNSTGDSNIKATIAVSSGKWYAEFTNLASAAIPCVVTTTTSNTANSFPNQAGGYGYLASAQKANNGTYTSYGATYTSSDVIGIALDLDAGTVTFYKNGASQGQAFSGLSGTFTFGISDTTYAAITANANFGQRPFAYTPPSGYVALNTNNLPNPNINNGALYMAATTYTGNGASRSITNGGNNTIGTTFQPDFVWIKSRSNALNSGLMDSVRGPTKLLISNATNAEQTLTDELTSFNSNGFSLGVSSNGYTNYNTYTYVAWQWQAGAGTTSSNTSGSITSTVSVNSTAGFSVVAYNSGASGDKTVGHGLGVAPSMIITKSRSSASYNWSIYHASVATTVKKYLTFTTDALQDNGINIWGSAFPTSSVFGITSGNGVVASTDCIAYCFSAVAGYSAFGSYTGNGSTDGPFVYLGFRPRFILYKNASFAGTSWAMLDSSRNTYNVENARLFADSSGAEDTSVSPMDFTSNGFKVRSTNDGVNRSGDTIIYAAFAENPFKIARAR